MKAVSEAEKKPDKAKQTSKRANLDKSELSISSEHLHKAARAMHIGVVPMIALANWSVKLTPVCPNSMLLANAEDWIFDRQAALAVRGILALTH